MKAAVIVSDYGFVNGGQAKVAIETALALRLEGMSVSFFSGVGPMDQRLEDAGVECICLGQYDLLGDPNRVRSGLRGLWNAQTAARLEALLRRFAPDEAIVHVHGWAKSLSPSIGPVITAARIPHVYTLHEYFLACPTGGFYDYQEREICTRRPLGASCLATNCDARRRAHKLWRVARQAVLWTAGAMPRALRDVIYLSNMQLAAIRDYLPASVRLHHLPNPVSTTPGARVPAERNDIYLFVGRLSAEKGPEIAALAAREAGVRIAFAGEGECRESILAANPDAQMLGWMKPDDLAEWTGKARCLVFPSLWYEGLPMVVLEAMQRGLPVLVSDGCAAAEVARHDMDGLHVRMGDRAAWAQAMQLMLDGRRVRRYSQSCLRAAEMFVDLDCYRRRLVAIYRDAAAAQLQERRRLN
jgi:glycosyltransferase involved in cell wall biosynthesis